MTPYSATAAGKSPLHISKATLDDAMWVADNLRQSDHEELSAATERTYRELLEESIEVSKTAFTIRAEKDGPPLDTEGTSGYRRNFWHPGLCGRQVGARSS